MKNLFFFFLSLMVLCFVQPSENVRLGSKFLITHTVKELSDVVSSDRDSVHSNSFRDGDGIEYLVTGKSVDKDTFVLVVTAIGKNAARHEVKEFRKRLEDLGHKANYEHHVNAIKQVVSDVENIIPAHYASRADLITNQLIIE